jgi:prophage tail gpP-like protein
MSDEVRLLIGGQEYTGWNEIRISRSLKECASSFDIAVSERWAGVDGGGAWQIKPFDKAMVYIDDDIVLTGYVESYLPSYEAADHSVRITGRSLTCDLVDCMPDVGKGQFSGYKLDAIANTICGYFGINVKVECDVGDPLTDAMIEKTETAFSFLEKLARLRSVLLTDDAQGNLVIAQAGSSGSASALVQGQNILAAKATLSGNMRFRDYVCLSQAPVSQDGSDAQLQVKGTASDGGCPRNRRFAEMSEHPATQPQADARAKWRAKHNFGYSTKASITVAGWRQAKPSGGPGGALWETNYLVPVHSPFLAIDRQLLVGKVEFQLDDQGGRRTVVTVAPQDAFTPEPGGGGSTGDTADNWNDGP